MTDERRAKRDEAIRARRNWKPTPTQEENDLTALGVPGDQVGKRDDGSGPDPHVEKNRAMWPEKDRRGAYKTR